MDGLRREHFTGNVQPLPRHEEVVMLQLIEVFEQMDLERPNGWWRNQKDRGNP